MILKHLRPVVVFAGVLLSASCGGQGNAPLAPPQSFSSLQSSASSTTSEAVAYQINTEHTGFAKGPLERPLTKLWSVDLPVGHRGIGYPVIANGVVVVAAYRDLVALDERTGKQLWIKHLPTGTYGWLGPAYDNGMIFASSSATYGPSGCGMCAFDLKTGKRLWSSPAVGQSEISSAPTAASGLVYTAAAGSGGTFYAFDESTGALKWTAPVDYGDDSSPVVAPDGVFASYACPQTYDFQPHSGKEIWHYSGPCAGGGGSTPVLYDGLLFVEDSDVSSAYNGLILNAKNGNAVGEFNAEYTPAFANHLGLFVYGFHTLTALSIPQMKQAWSVNLPSSDSYETAAIVIGNIAYMATFKNYLVGYDMANGKQKVLIQLSNDGFNANSGASLAFGDGELIVPNGKHLVAFGGSQK